MPLKFDKEIKSRIKNIKKNKSLIDIANKFMIESTIPKYSYNFKSLGRPIIQYPQDIVCLQELIWKIKPDLIIETGIAHGGSLILNASMLSLIDKWRNVRKLKYIKTKVIGIDIDIRKHNKKAIQSHFLSNYIDLIQGDSTSFKVFDKVLKISQNYKKVLVMLDSNHTQEHVMKELNFYSKLVTKNSYCVVFDTIIGKMNKKLYPDRPWDFNNSPLQAVKKFLKNNKNFVSDISIDNKLLISVSPEGYLKKIK